MSIEATRSGFEASFEEADFYNKQTQDEKHLKDILATINVKPGMKILDIGCGSGYLTFPIAEINKDTHVIGLDIVTDTLKRNTWKAQEKGIRNLEFVSYDGITFPFEDNSFDLVVTRYALHHFPEIKKSICEVARVLKYDGLFFISDPRPNDCDITRFVDDYMQLKKDGHIKFYTKDEWMQLCGENNMHLIQSFDSEIRFPKKKSTAEGFEAVLVRHEKSIVDSYRLAQTEDEIWVTEQVNNLLFTKGESMRFVKDYMKNEILRHELNELTQATFYFDFESWVTNGYFEGDYIPYSFEEDGKIISNVSANIMHFIQNGEQRKYIQIGTVMTATDHRKQGLARKLMEHVIETYEGTCDGIYLFGNLSALDFYRKLGFEERMQYRYILRDDVRIQIQKRIASKEHSNGFVKLDCSDVKSKEKYCEAVRNSVANGAFEQENKYGLQMFYTSDLGNVYYSKELDCFAVMEQNGEKLELHSVISTKHVSLEDVICEINSDYMELRLGFTPRKDEVDLFDISVFDGGDDYRLFCRGSRLESIEQEKLYFPTFSHA